MELEEVIFGVGLVGGRVYMYAYPKLYIDSAAILNCIGISQKRIPKQQGAQHNRD